MTILEAHQALSRSLGDSFALSSNATVIPDGVRYSTAQRNNYLYRAMLYILDEVFVSVQHLERKDANKALYKLIPNMITTSYDVINFNSSTNDRLAYGTFTINNATISVAKLMACTADSDYKTGALVATSVPVNIYSSLANVRNARLSLRPDPFIYMDDPTHWFLQDEMFELTDGGSIYFELIRYPDNPSTLSMAATLPFEDKYLTKIIQLASMYAWQDSEDLENASMLAQTIKPIQPLQEIRNANSNQ